MENKIDDPRGRLIRLIQYTTDEARDMIHHCIQQPSATGYKTAMMLLQKKIRQSTYDFGCVQKRNKELAFWSNLVMQNHSEVSRIS